MDLHTHLAFARPFVVGGILWSLLGLLVAALFIILPDRPYAPAIFLGIAVAVMGIFVAAPTRVACRRADHYPSHLPGTGGER
jgi:hypothetical protein